MKKFLDFIIEDIEAKKSHLSSLPTRTKLNKAKYLEQLEIILNRYYEYETSLEKYITVKSKSFSPKVKKVDEKVLKEKVVDLENKRFLLNPENTMFEKLGFDTLIYKLKNYRSFDFKEMNSLIDEFLNIFEEANIRLTATDFEYTPYVHEYMEEFFRVRSKGKNFKVLNETFERIYWFNPKLIAHIEISLRKNIVKNAKKLDDYVLRKQKEIIAENILGYEDCERKLKEAYVAYLSTQKEDITKIIELAKEEVINIENYSDGNKIREENFLSLMIKPFDLKDVRRMDRFYDTLEKLNYNLDEYTNYLKFLPLINQFKLDYEKKVTVDPEPEKKSRRKGPIPKIKELENKINETEQKLQKVTKKIIHKSFGIFEKRPSSTRDLKEESLVLADDIYTLYEEYDEEYFNEKVLSKLGGSFTVNNLLKLYYSFDYHKKKAIGKYLDLTEYQEVLQYDTNFNKFVQNPNNIITKGINVFGELNVRKIIVDKYRLDNVNLEEDMLHPGELETLMNKIQFVFRIKAIQEANLKVEQVWFISEVYKKTKEEE